MADEVVQLLRSLPVEVPGGRTDIVALEDRTVHAWEKEDRSSASRDCSGEPCMD